MTSEELFKLNLSASQHIMAGNIEEATNILESLETNHLVDINTRTKFLLQNTKAKFSGIQKQALEFKRQLTKEIINSRY